MAANQNIYKKFLNNEKGIRFAPIPFYLFKYDRLEVR